MDEYNPLDYRNLTVNLIRELMSRGPFALPPAPRFPGAGVYALFYTGEFDLYGPVRSIDCSRPIYVGKSVPSGARKGRQTGSESVGSELFSRLREHSRSIEDSDLAVSDFACRFLVVNPLWITMAERFLIEEFQPLWNVCLEGFGIHDPGSGRRAGERSWWDGLHPGRSWASKQRTTRSQAESISRVREFFARLAADPEAVRAEAKKVAADLAEIGS